MQVNASFMQKNGKFADELKKRIDKAKKLEAACGFPNSLNKTYDNGASIIDVAIWNNYGTYCSPARDFMTPAINNIKMRWGQMMKEATPAMNAGKISAEKVLNQGGLMAQGQIRNSIVELDTPANAPLTIEGGWAHNKKSGKIFYTPGKGSDNPLIDTGLMVGSVTYTIRKRS